MATHSSKRACRGTHKSGCWSRQMYPVCVSALLLGCGSSAGVRPPAEPRASEQVPQERVLREPPNDAGDDPDARPSVELRRQKSASVRQQFHRALAIGLVDEVNAAIAAGASPTEALSGGATPLAVAATNGHYAIAKLLMELGVRADERVGPFKMTALQFLGGRFTNFDDLREQGANPHVTTAIYKDQPLVLPKDDEALKS